MKRVASLVSYLFLLFVAAPRLMTEKQVQQGLGKLSGGKKAPRLRDRVNTYLQQSYAAFGRTIRP